MALQPFLSILETNSAVKRDNNSYVIAEELDVTLFVTLGKDVMQVPKLARLDRKDEIVHLTTQKGDRFFFFEGDVVGLSFGAQNGKSKSAGAGFLPSGTVLSSR